nr:sigma factor-like helix-turn-helix DNA-binding protein [Sporichthya sp.]
MTLGVPGLPHPRIGLFPGLVRLRFYDDHSQAEIARRLGISQPHVSRLLDSTLADLRTQLMASCPEPPRTPLLAVARVRSPGAGRRTA